MQGDGVQVPPDDYFARAKAVCDKYDVLFIGDEVITGFGRCGYWFALEHWGVVPDIMSTAKAITAGYFPLGASTVSRKVADALPAFTPRPDLQRPSRRLRRSDGNHRYP